MHPIFDKIFAQIISGIAYGSIYGLFALSIVFLFRANRLFNLASTELATFFVVCMFFLLKHMSYFPAFALTVVFSFVAGCCLHFGLMRIVTERKNALHSNETVITIGLFIILNSLSAFFFSDEPKKFPTPFSESLVSLGGIKVPSHSFLILGISLVIAFSFFLFLHKTRLGLIMEATAQNTMSARLRGIKTSNMLALAWGIATAISVISGVLIAPVLFLSPGMLSQVFSYALIAVVIGGLESPFGAIVGGILVGVVENLATDIGFIGSELKFMAVFFLLLVVLVVKPRGLWGREELRRA
jgi:branched-chain amino acid transport system permease protein